MLLSSPISLILISHHSQISFVNLFFVFLPLFPFPALQVPGVRFSIFSNDISGLKNHLDDLYIFSGPKMEWRLVRREIQGYFTRKEFARVLKVGWGGGGGGWGDGGEGVQRYFPAQVLFFKIPFIKYSFLNFPMAVLQPEIHFQSAQKWANPRSVPPFLRVWVPALNSRVLLATVYADCIFKS